MRSLPSDSVPVFNVALQTWHELPVNFTGTRHPIASENNMSSLPSNSVPGFNVALQTAHELPLNFTARRHGIASFLCVASQIASLDAPIRCALVLHPDFPVELKTNSKCNGHIAFLPISSVRFMPV